MSNYSNQRDSHLGVYSGVYEIPPRRGSSTIEIIVEKMPTVPEEPLSLGVEYPLKYRGRKYQDLLSKYAPGLPDVPVLEGWRKTMRELLHAMNLHIAPGPRNYILEEFKEFSRKQIEFFIYIYYSFKNAKNRFMGFEEFRYFMNTMKMIDAMTLSDIFDGADINQDRELSAEEFLTLFRMSNNLEYSEPLSVLRDIAHSDHADVNDDKNEPDNCSQCVKIVLDEDVLELTTWNATKEYYHWRNQTFGCQDERNFFSTEKSLIGQSEEESHPATKNALNFLLTLKAKTGSEAQVVGFPDMEGTMNFPSVSCLPHQQAETPKKKSNLLSRAKSWIRSKNDSSSSKSSKSVSQIPNASK
ncbi:hypothetical protein L3Y34_016187 [Caenorhabditis briggsae]|uniref:EF-hand domain-containing protein n=1 Tax=Caenorhabditis briggsae TaxID=6238 RepID=A0AAE9DVM5_CAEBR|nr:hypothetical protein L3Y34_016187 [Caenorhabditis briggsae]